MVDIRITEEGFNPPTLEQVYTQLMEDAKKNVAGFTQMPAEIQNNLVQESSIPMLYFLQGISALINNMLPTTANEQSFLNFGTGLGLIYHKERNTQVSLSFSGNAGTFIPEGLVCSDVHSIINVVTLNEGFIQKNGNLTLLAESTADGAVQIDANIITILSEIIEGISVINPSAGIEGASNENIDEYKKRVYRSIKTSAYGQINDLYAKISNVSGVNMLLFNPYEKVNADNTRELQVVVGGGSDLDVAIAINSGSGLSGIALTSTPSEGESVRTVKVPITILNTSRDIIFTRPKQSKIDITIKYYTNVYINNDQVYTVILAAYTKYFSERLFVGVPISLAKLQELFLQEMSVLIDVSNIGNIDFELTIDAVAVPAVDLAKGFIEIQYDQYLLLNSITTVLIS